MEWLERLSSALDFIEKKLTDKVDAAEIAKQAYSSPYHFQRMFHLHTGVTLAEYVRKRKMTLAAQELVVEPVKIMDISFKYGYESPEAFAKVFRRIHGISPSEVRGDGVTLQAFPRIRLQLATRANRNVEYRIMTRNALCVIGKATHVTLKDGEELRRIPRFWKECEVDGTVDRLRALSSDGRLLGISIPDYENEELRYTVAAASDDVPTGQDLLTWSIPRSTWAVFTSSGVMPGAIQELWRYIYQVWLPATGYQKCGGPEIEVYFPGDVYSEAYKSEVWIPLQMSRPIKTKSLF